MPAGALERVTCVETVMQRPREDKTLRGTHSIRSFLLSLRVPDTATKVPKTTDPAEGTNNPVDHAPRLVVNAIDPQADETRDSSGGDPVVAVNHVPVGVYQKSTH